MRSKEEIFWFSFILMFAFTFLLSRVIYTPLHEYVHVWICENYGGEVQRVVWLPYLETKLIQAHVVCAQPMKYWWIHRLWDKIDVYYTFFAFVTCWFFSLYL